MTAYKKPIGAVVKNKTKAMQKSNKLLNKGIGFDCIINYFLELALALDNAGNVLMQHVLNDALLIKNEKTYLFGNKMETISSVIGKNLVTHTLSTVGILLNTFLHWIDKDHSLNSINYEVRLWKAKQVADNL